MHPEVNDSSRISVTAHYTSYVWKKNKLSEVDLSTSKGWFLYQLGRPFNFLAGKSNLESFLVQRHSMIDALLSSEIEAGRVGQVVELASGLSSRGIKFSKRYGKSHNLIYVESDLPNQIQTKKEKLKQ